MTMNAEVNVIGSSKRRNLEIEGYQVTDVPTLFATHRGMTVQLLTALGWSAHRR